MFDIPRLLNILSGVGIIALIIICIVIIILGIRWLANLLDIG